MHHVHSFIVLISRSISPTSSLVTVVLTLLLGVHMLFRISNFEILKVRKSVLDAFVLVICMVANCPSNGDALVVI